MVILCLLFFVIAYYFNTQNSLDEEISQQITQHIALIQVSNEISSYAKRAEGHMLLFLTLANKAGREKVSKRSDSLLAATTALFA